MVGDIDQVVHSDGGADKTFMQDTFVQAIGPASEHRLATCWRFGDSLALPLGLHADKPYPADTGRQTDIEILAGGRRQVGRRSDPRGFRIRPGSVRGQSAEPGRAVAHPGSAVQLENALALRGYATEPCGFEPFALRPEILFLRVLVAWATDNIDTLAQAMSRSSSVPWPSSPAA